MYTSAVTLTRGAKFRALITSPKHDWLNNWARGWPDPRTARRLDHRMNYPARRSLQKGRSGRWLWRGLWSTCLCVATWTRHHSTLESYAAHSAGLFSAFPLAVFSEFWALPPRETESPLVAKWRPALILSVLRGHAKNNLHKAERSQWRKKKRRKSSLRSLDYTISAYFFQEPLSGRFVHDFYDYLVARISSDDKLSSFLKDTITCRTRIRWSKRSA